MQGGRHSRPQILAAMLLMAKAQYHHHHQGFGRGFPPSSFLPLLSFSCLLYPLQFFLFIQTRLWSNPGEAIAAGFAQAQILI